MEEKNPLTGTFYLVRHAHADWTSDENRPLSARGRADANHVAEILLHYPVRAIYTSPYRRAWETISPLSKRLQLPVQIEPDLREVDLSNVKFDDFFKAAAVTWRDPTFAYPGGESNAAAQQRVLVVLLRLKQQHLKEPIVIATHGTLLAVLLQYFNPALDFSFWKSLTMPDIYSLSLDPLGKAVIHRLR